LNGARPARHAGLHQASINKTLDMPVPTSRAMEQRGVSLLAGARSAGAWLRHDHADLDKARVMAPGYGMTMPTSTRRA
jgi:hypothetical protein